MHFILYVQMEQGSDYMEVFFTFPDVGTASTTLGTLSLAAEVKSIELTDDDGQVLARMFRDESGEAVIVVNDE